MNSSNILTNIEYLPIWKKGATAEERFLELSHIARKHPERFESFVLIHEERLDGREDKMKIDYACHNVDTMKLLGLIELGKRRVLKVTHGED